MGGSAKRMSFASPVVSRNSEKFKYTRESDDEDNGQNDGVADQHLRAGKSPSETSKGNTPSQIHIPSHIMADYNSADERILQLKQAGYTSAGVAKQLQEEGMSEFTERVVGNRWIRLRLALEQAEQERMEDGVFDWKMGEDEALYEAVELAVSKHLEDMEKLKEKMWKNVSTKVADSIGAKKYTGQACRERYKALQDGTALLPIEIDPDQEGRAALRASRIAEMKAFRAKQIKVMQEAEDDKLLYSSDRKAYMEKHIDRLSEKDAGRLAEQQEKGRLSTARKNATVQRAEAVKLKSERARLAREWQDQVTDIENTTYAKLTGKALGGGSRARVALQVVKKRQNGILACMLTDDEKDSDDEEPAAIPSGKARVTDDTRFSPRSIMSIKELEVVLAKRGLPRRKPAETHEQVVARLHWTDSLLKGDQLGDLLLEHFDKGKGPKDLKAWKLARRDAEASSAGQHGGHHTDKTFQANYDGTRTS